MHFFSESAVLMQVFDRLQLEILITKKFKPRIVNNRKLASIQSIQKFKKKEFL